MENIQIAMNEQGLKVRVKRRGMSDWSMIYFGLIRASTTHPLKFCVMILTRRLGSPSPKLISLRYHTSACDERRLDASICSVGGFMVIPYFHSSLPRSGVIMYDSTWWRCSQAYRCGPPRQPVRAELCSGHAHYADERSVWKVCLQGAWWFTSNGMIIGIAK